MAFRALNLWEVYKLAQIYVLFLPLYRLDAGEPKFLFEFEVNPRVFEPVAMRTVPQHPTFKYCKPSKTAIESVDVRPLPPVDTQFRDIKNESGIRIFSIFDGFMQMVVTVHFI